MNASGTGSVASALRAPGRDALLVLGVLLLLTVALFWPSITALAEIWSDPHRRTYQHGYVIAALVLWLIFRERHRIAAADPRPAPVVLLLALAGGVAWAVAWNAGLQIVHFLLWPAILWAAATAVLGLPAGRILLMPVAILYFAMPIWDALTPMLQSVTVLANKFMAALIGMPVLIEGNYIHIPEGSFEIAGGCSGLNYLIVGLAIAALLGEVNGDRPRRRLLLIAISGALALFSNWLRVFIIIYAGHVSDMTHYLVRVDHYNFGWVLYAFVLALFFYIARKLPAAASAEEPVAAEPPRPAARFRVGLMLAAAISIAVGPLLAGRIQWFNADAATQQAVGLGHLELPGASQWNALPAIGSWVPVFPGADAESLVEFSQGDARVTVYTATYRRQVQGRELVGHDSRVEGHDAGSLTAIGTRLAVAEPAIEAMEAEFRSTGGARSVLWWTYRIGERDFSRGLPAQLWYGVASLWSAPVSAIVALRADCRPDCAAARIALERFAADALPELLTAASRTGS